MPPPGSDVNNAIAEVRHYFDPIVSGVRVGVQSSVQSGYRYASQLGLRMYNFYNLARYGQAPPPQYGWREGYAPEQLEEGVHSAPRSWSDPLHYMRLSSSQLPPQNRSSHESIQRRLQQTEKIIRKQQKLSAAQETVSKRRVESTQHREILLSSLDFLDETIEAIAKLLSLRSSEQAGLTELGELLDQFRGDRTKLQADITLVREDDATLISLDRALDVQGDKLVQAASTLIPTTSLRRTAFGPVSQSSTASGSHRSPSPVPSLITRYLDRRGDVQMLKEKLHNFTANHMEELQYREVQKEQDAKLAISDEVFEQLYLQEREEIKHELALAEQDLTDLEIDGKRQGLDTTFAARRSFEVDSESESPLGEHFYVVPRSTTDVSGWMNEIPTPVVDGAPDYQNATLPSPTTPAGCPPSWSL